MFKEKLKQIGKNDGDNKKKIENIVFLIIVLIITILIINVILKGDDKTSIKEENQSNSYKTLVKEEENDENNLENNLEKILSSIKGVGKVNVFINYSESSKTVAMYDETTTTSSTEETDSSGGVRNVTSTQTQKDVIYSEEDGNQTPVTERVIMPTIEGAIITAEGASNASVRTNIVNAVQAATGLGIDKIQVFEMEKWVEKLHRKIFLQFFMLTNLIRFSRPQIKNIKIKG